MDITTLHQYISDYKKEFKKVSNKEIYKWKAIQTFQDNWDLDATRFGSMIERSLKDTKNLLGSNNYFPRRMIRHYAKAFPDDLRTAFEHLFNEETDLIFRISEFQTNTATIHNKAFPDADINTYQDVRAILVYLTLRYPDRYYLYKFKMFKQFASLTQYPYTPVRGRIENITHFQSLCSIVRDEIKKDNELLHLHFSRLKTEHYTDTDLNVLTQDFIYACTVHLKINVAPQTNFVLPRLVDVNFSISGFSTNLSASNVNHLANARVNKVLGDLGELYILEYERRKLRQFNVDKSPTHVAKDVGDGLGYDILSYTENGEEKYIEVKTTSGDVTTPFYITNNELVKSQKNSNNYYLYRLHNFDKINNTGDLWIFQGDLSKFCVNPIQFKVVLQINS